MHTPRRRNRSLRVWVLQRKGAGRLASRPFQVENERDEYSTPKVRTEDRRGEHRTVADADGVRHYLGFATLCALPSTHAARRITNDNEEDGEGVT